MRNFDYYEFAGIFVPGAVALFGLSLVIQEVNTLLLSNQNQFSAISIMLVISYACGYLVQAVGNILEKMWWKFRKGWPTDWIMIESNNTYSEHWRESIYSHFMSEGKNPFVNKRTWIGFTREIYAEIKAASLHDRVDFFNGSYGLTRGIASSLILILIVVVVLKGVIINVCLSLVVAIVLSIYSMDKYARTYARELFAQYVYLIKSKLNREITDTNISNVTN